MWFKWVWILMQDTVQLSTGPCLTDRQTDMYFWSNISESKADYAKCACVIWPSSVYKYAQRCYWCQTGSRLLNIWWSRFKPMGISWVQSNTRGLHNPQQRSWKKFTRFFSTPRLHTQRNREKKEETFKIFCTWLLHSHHLLSYYIPYYVPHLLSMYLAPRH